MWSDCRQCRIDSYDSERRRFSFDDDEVCLLKLASERDDERVIVGDSRQE